MRNLLSLTSSFVLAASLVLPGVAAAGPAAEPPGVLIVAEECSTTHSMCVYWGKEYNGAAAGWNSEVDDYMKWTFPHNGSGGGQRIGNNGGSFMNWKFDRSITVFYNPAVNWDRPPGPSLHIGPRDGKNCRAAGPLICNNNRAYLFN